MAIKRRDFLLFLGAGAGTLALGACSKKLPFSSSPLKPESWASSLGFQPVKGPMPLPFEAPENTVVSVNYVSTAEPISPYSTYEVVDDLVVPEGFTYHVIAEWGDPVGDSRFGYNNDYLSFISTGENEGFLTVNFEYISYKTWRQTFEEVIGKALPFATLNQGMKATGNPAINAFGLPAKNSLKPIIQEISQAGLTDIGIGVISIRRRGDGVWERTYSHVDRRITGLSGYKDDRYLYATGPGVAIFRKRGQGYDDKLGDKIIGTVGNCAGGTTPWGTVLSAEENFQSLVTEEVFPDGTPWDPSHKPFYFDDQGLSGLGNVFGLAGHKYGWIVEVDPANSEDYGTKHTWLGRYRHEAVGVRVVPGKPLAFYSGCDRQGGHLYKFVSDKIVVNPQDKSNSQLLTSGMLYAAKFYLDGTGRWIPLKPETAVDPELPSVHLGGMIPLPQRPKGGSFLVTKDSEISQFKQKFKTLADLYQGNAQEKQGAILIDAHLAANAAGATCTARPEDTVIGPDGALFIAFTSGSISPKEGSPNQQVFAGPDGQLHHYGWIMRLDEDNNEPGAGTFRWQMFATGGEPATGGQGFSNPDNLAFDPQGNLWMVTDLSTGGQNGPVPARIDETGKPLSQSKLIGLFGNNSLWYFPTSGPHAGQGFLFGIGPMDCELCGPYFTEDYQTLFLAVQHPGELNGTRKNFARETRQFVMTTPEGQEFLQTREVPIGSNWPGKEANQPPKPAVVAIHRIDSQSLLPG